MCCQFRYRLFKISFGLWIWGLYSVSYRWFGSTLCSSPVSQIISTIRWVGNESVISMVEQTPVNNWPFEDGLWPRRGYANSVCWKRICFSYWCWQWGIICHIHSFIHLACAECDDSLPFSGASSIPLSYILFPATLLHQLFVHPLSPYLAIYFLVSLSNINDIVSGN
jgi:hypothetical protein